MRHNFRAPSEFKDAILKTTQQMHFKRLKTDIDEQELKAKRYNKKFNFFMIVFIISSVSAYAIFHFI